MLMQTQPEFNVSAILDSDPAVPDLTLTPSQLSENSELIQLHGQTQILSAVDIPNYPESAYQWLVGVLDGLIDFGQRHGHYGTIKLTEDEYQWLNEILKKLIFSIGENENHPLAPLMEFVIRLIDNYEDAYVPKLTELFPELAEEEIVDTSPSENKQTNVNTPELSDIELAAHAFFSMGYLLYHGNRIEKAISAYDKAIVLNPDFWKAFYNRGIARYDFKQYAEAMTDFNKAIELNHNFSSAYYNRGIARFKLDRHESAIADFDKAITLGFNCAEVYYHRASANTLLGEYDAAVSDYDKVIALKPDFVEETYNIRGILRSELGQYDEAIADYTEAIRIKPDYAEAYAYRGVLKAHLGRINKARSDFQKALELAKRSENNNLKAFVENQLQQLNQVVSKQNNKKPRRGGQWKGKVKIADDFDELPESFMTFFHGEDK